MFYSVSEISELINLSKVSIYKKLKAEQFESHIIKKKGTTYIDKEGFELLKRSLKLNTEEKKDLNSSNINLENMIDTDELNELKILRQDYIATMKKQLDQKDKQIEELHRLIENNQILLKQEKQVNQLQLEEHLKEFDLKLNNVMEKMKNRKKEDKTSLFHKIFRHKKMY